MNTFYMNNIKFSPIFLLTLMLFSFSNNSFADIYRWKDSKGVMQYSDRPPSAITKKQSEDILLKVIRDQDLCAAPTKVKTKSLDPIVLNALIRRLSTNLSVGTATSSSTTTTAARSNSLTTNYRKIASSTTTSTPTGVDVVGTTSGTTTGTTSGTTTGTTSGTTTGTTSGTTTGTTSGTTTGTTSGTTTGTTSGTTTGTTSGTTTGTTSGTTTGTTSGTTTGTTSGTTTGTTSGTTTGTTSGTTTGTTSGTTTAVASLEPPPHATWCEGSCTLPAGVTAKVWYGVAQTKWVTKSNLSGTFTCNDSTFGSNAGTTAYKRCAWVDMATLNALNPNGANLMPYVDMTSLPTPNPGFSTLKLSTIPVIAGRDPSSNGGEFRIRCGISHLAKDDPIVYPNVPGAAHLHAFFGNAGINAYSTNESLRTTGNSTCSGGIANRSGYWVPALIDTTTGKPANPYDVITYYKSDGSPSSTTDYTTAPPKGLRMIAGNQKPLSIADSSGYYLCMDSQQAMNPANWGVLWESDHIKTCGDGTNRYTLRFKVVFPQCWDGKNLDSPDHQSHMAYACKYGQCELANGTLGKTVNGCPITHPVLIPQVTVNANYTKLTNHVYRLSSDNYSTKYPGGYSLHADWMNGWDETIMNRIIKSCMLKHADCGTDQLGDGQALVPYDK